MREMRAYGSLSRSLLSSLSSISSETQRIGFCLFTTQEKPEIQYSSRTVYHTHSFNEFSIEFDNVLTLYIVTTAF